MSRTYRTDTQYQPRKAREGRGAFQCPEGRGCSYCISSRLHGRTLAAARAADAVVAYWDEALNAESDAFAAGDEAWAEFLAAWTAEEESGWARQYDGRWSA